MQGRNPRRQCVRALSSGCAPHRLRRWAVRHITLTLTCKIIALLLAEYWRRSHRLSTLKSNDYQMASLVALFRVVLSCLFLWVLCSTSTTELCRVRACTRACAGVCCACYLSTQGLSTPTTGPSRSYVRGSSSACDATPPCFTPP